MVQISTILKLWFDVFRSLALLVILTRAGLGLDQDAIRKRLGAVMSLAFFPTIAITLFITVAARYILDFPWIFSAALGYVVHCFIKSRASALCPSVNGNTE